MPGCAHLGAGVAVAQGVPQPPLPRTPWGGGTYMDGAITEAVHHPPVTSPRLRAGQWPDPNGGGWGGTQRGVAAWGPRGAPQCPCPGQERCWSLPCPRALCAPPPYLSTTLRRVSLPATGPSRSAPGLLWGTEGRRAVGWWVPPSWGTCLQAPQEPGQRGPWSPCALVLPSPLCPGPW